MNKPAVPLVPPGDSRTGVASRSCPEFGLEASPKPDVSVVIVTYNSAECIEPCVNSLLRQEGASLEIIVVDNASTDQTVEVVGRLGPSVRLLANPDNRGFGQGCNLGFSLCRGRFVFFLNPDAWLEQADALSRLCRTMEQNPRWGLAGTRVTESDGATECPPALRYPDQHRVNRDFSHLPGSIAWVFGASMFIRREVFVAVGGFDPGFFLTSEETDLCLRIRQKGWEIGYVGEVTARHLGSASERGNDPYDTWFRRVPGIYRFWSKHYPAADARRLVRKDWFRAGFRRDWYAAMAWLYGPRSTAWRKHRQYAGITAAARLFLREGEAKTTQGRTQD